MIPKGNLPGNIERFSGFQDIYDRFRPEAPSLLVPLLTSYAGGRPELVLDLGCGTGLSTFIWQEAAAQVVGVEPNGDMLSKAQAKAAARGVEARVRFIQGYSNALPFAAGSADIITCSQSFHWMEPVSTLSEAARVLRDGGVFAAFDCDWPPTAHWTVEAAFIALHAQANELAGRLTDGAARAVKRDKEKHLEQIRSSGLFRYAREAVFHHTERCDAERYFGLAMSQGSVQTVLKLDPHALDEALGAFREATERYFAGRVLEVQFGYRLRLGLK